MSKRVYALLSKKGPLMQWAEEKGYQPPDSENSLLVEIAVVEHELWDIEFKIADLCIQQEQATQKLVELQKKLEEVEEGEYVPAPAVILHIRPGGADDTD